MIARVKIVLVAFAAYMLLATLAASPAFAEPQLGLRLERTTTPLHRGDERVVYLLKVENEATSRPSEGDELTCKGTPADGVSWFGAPPPTFSYQWLRNGAEIIGASSKSYTVTAADAGASLQCVLSGVNQLTDSEGNHLSAYPPLTSSYVSAPVVAEPQPATAPPKGNSQPGIAGPVAAAAVGTAKTTAGSKVITEVVTAEGTGDLTAGSKEVKNVSMTRGVFISETLQQEITNPALPAETRITGVDPFKHTLMLSKSATASVSDVTLKAGALPFQQGVTVSGPGIPAGAKISNGNSGAQTFELDVAATATANGVTISGTSEETCGQPSGWTAGTPITWTYQWLRNGAPIPGATNPAYVVQSADVEPPSMLQCEAIATDAEGGRAVVLSNVEPTRPKPPSPYVSPVGSSPTIEFKNQTTGSVTAELELPAGEETYAFKVVSSSAIWKCSKTVPSPFAHAIVTCTRSDTLAPEAAYAPIEVVAALGKNPPDILRAEARVFGGGSVEPPPVENSFEIGAAIPWGFSAFETENVDVLGNDYTRAGGHPFLAGAKLQFTTHVRAEATPSAGFRAANGSARVVRTDIPPGFIGNPTAAPARCPAVNDIIRKPSTCPPASIVGGITLETFNHTFKNIPIFEIEPERGAIAEFAFGVPGPKLAFALTPELRPAEGYGITLLTAPAPKTPELYGAEVKLCGFGAKSRLSEESTAEKETEFVGCRQEREAGSNPTPFLTNPTRCEGEPPTTRIFADTWEHPGEYAKAQFSAPAVTNCDEVPFEPEISLRPTSSLADSPTGLNVTLRMPTEGLLTQGGIAQAALKQTVVKLPQGMTVNPASAQGLGACGSAQIGIGTNDPVSCPESSKIGSVEVSTPLLGDNEEGEVDLTGSVYLAKQADNPFQSLLALYLVLESKERGILVKLPGRVETSPSGQLTTSFDNNPQVPFDSLTLHFNSGDRAPLINPPTCGTYAISSVLSPWSAADPDNPSAAEIVNAKSSFRINRGPGGRPCPRPNLEPKLRAGFINPVAASTSPFNLGLSREDGTQRFNSLQVTLPPGFAAYLKGIPYCPDSTLASIPTAEGTGAAQIASPSCPAASQVGTVTAGAGAGPDPFYVNTGRAYLAGPYKGAPLSMAIVTPAVAGPFDLGNVVVRTALRIDPITAQITAVSDPIPTVVHGIPLDIRDIRVAVDRPSFTVAPTNCEPMSVGAQVGGAEGGNASVSVPFQLSGCDKLKFAPHLKLRLRGGTRRGAYQRLTATVTYPKGSGYANIARAAVTLPHSAFLAQEHIRTICTRVQFAASQCPPGSIYGYAKATSPLLGYAVQGPVYLRSSDHPLPDLVAALRGPAEQPIEIDLVGRVDSKNGGIRNTFEVVPDAPVSKFTLQMKGGKKSLIVNSRDLCKGVQRATVRLRAQNGLRDDFRPVVSNDCTAKKGKSSRRHRRQNR